MLQLFLFSFVRFLCSCSFLCYKVLLLCSSLHDLLVSCMDPRYFSWKSLACFLWEPTKILLGPCMLLVSGASPYSVARIRCEPVMLMVAQCCSCQVRTCHAYIVAQCCSCKVRARTVSGRTMLLVPGTLSVERWCSSHMWARDGSAEEELLMPRVSSRCFFSQLELSSDRTCFLLKKKHSTCTTIERWRDI